MHRIRLASTVCALTAAALTLGVSPGWASCAEESGPEGEQVVFVGTADTERRGYTRLRVEEVWNGPDLAPRVWVRSGQEQPPFPLSLVTSVSGSGDAELVEGRRYVVGASEQFTTSLCSVTAVEGPLRNTPGRPREARAPDVSGLTGVDPPAGPWEIAAVLAALVLAGGWLVHAVRRRGD